MAQDVGCSILSLPPTAACILVHVHADVPIGDDADFDLRGHPWSAAMHWVPLSSRRSLHVTVPSMEMSTHVCLPVPDVIK